MALTKSKSGIIYNKKATEKYTKKVVAAVEKYSQSYTAQEVNYIIFQKYGYLGGTKGNEYTLSATGQTFICKS